MVVVMQVGAPEAHVENVIQRLSAKGFDVLRTSGQQQTVLCAIGVQRDFQLRQVRILDGVAEVYRITTPYKLASRTWQKERTVVHLGNAVVGGNEVLLMDEISADMVDISESVDVESSEGEVNLYHISAGNMQNNSLLRAVGRTQTPVLLRRNSLASVQEWLVSAEVILTGGNPNVILCEGASRPFAVGEPSSFFRPVDIAIIPEVKETTHLPIVVDPTVSRGGLRHQFPVTRSAVAAGADGIWVKFSTTDSAGAVADENHQHEISGLIKELELIALAIGRSLRG